MRGIKVANGTVWTDTPVLTKDSGKSKIPKLDESCVSSPKSEVANWTF